MTFNSNSNDVLNNDGTELSLKMRRYPFFFFFFFFVSRDSLVEGKRISRRFQVYTSYRVTMRFGLRLTADKERKKGIQSKKMRS